MEKQTKSKRKENLPWLMEFAVPGKNLKLLKDNAARVKKLFKAEVIFSDPFQRGDVEMQWINFMGGEASAEEMKCAKEYITSMTNPEACIRVENFSPPLFDSSVDEVEISTSAFLTLKKGGVEIKGSELAVVLAQSMLENIQQEDANYGKINENSSASYFPSNSLQDFSNRPSTSNQSTARSRSPAPGSISSSSIASFSSSPDSETTYVKRVEPDDAYRMVVSASSYGGDVLDGATTKEPRNAGFHKDFTSWSDNRTDMQFNYLKSVGLANNFDLDITEEGLSKCDMNDVIVPSKFLEILKDIRLRHDGSSSDLSDNSRRNPKSVCGPPHAQATSLPSRSKPTPPPPSAAELDESVIIIEPEECEEEFDNAIVISSEEEEEKNETQPDANQFKKKKKQKKKKKVNSQQQPEENLVLPRPLPKSKQPVQKEKNTKNNPQTSHSLGNLPPSVTPSHQQTIVAPGQKKKLRYIVIDGSNVAMAHGEGKVYSVKGIQICIEFFLSRGHQVTAFVPESRRYSNNQIPIARKALLEKLNQDGHLKFTPARRITTGKIIASYDDRFILNLAEAEQGIVVSNDQYRDLLYSKPSYKEIIETRLLQFMFVGDHFMPPDDPLGRDGPTLDEFLCFPTQPAEKGYPLRSRGASGQEAQTTVAPRNPWQHQKVWGEQKRKEKEKDYSDKAWKNDRALNIPVHGLDLQNGLSHQQQDPNNPPPSGRTDRQTTELYDQLSLMFPEPEQQPRVFAILENHPNEMDIMRLSNYVLNALT